QSAGPAQSAGPGAEIPRATFDPAWALDDPDVTLLDVGHPLVRRLIEEVKQQAFRRADHYGRSAYLVTLDVEEVTALFHLLVRYVVATEPVSIVEELLPVAAPVYSVEPTALNHTQSVALAQATPNAQTRTLGEVQEALSDALAMEGLDKLLAGAVEARRQVLVAERQRMQQAQGGELGDQPAAWLSGIADLEPGSYDLLAVTVLFPG
ncbi:MAG: helicase, partial [Anaerolineae bacterium]|nr:helicase [Anaerolineae bacterium]